MGEQSVAVRAEELRAEERRALRNARTFVPSASAKERERKKKRALSAEEFASAESRDATDVARRRRRWHSRERDEGNPARARRYAVRGKIGHSA